MRIQFPQQRRRTGGKGRFALQSEGTGLLTRNHRQEALSRAYVQAIAARCGMSVSTSYPDYGIDMSLNEIEISDHVRRESGYKLDVQAKATTRAGVTEDSVWYDLEVRSYDLLRASPVKKPAHSYRSDASRRRVAVVQSERARVSPASLRLLAFTKGKAAKHESQIGSCLYS
jgi:Domain of unknown function (DUF4365)